MSIKDVLIGSTPAQRLYRGETLLWQRSRLPFEYKEVKYIESTGTQYINTGFKPTIYTSIETVFSTKQSPNDTNLFGSRTRKNLTNSNDYTVWINTSSGKGIACHFPISANASKDTAWVYKGNIIDTPTKLLIAPENIKVNDVLVYTFSGTRTEYEPALNAYIFAKNQGGQINLPGKFRVYYFQIYDGDEMVRDFIPCYHESDGEIGMYDIVNDVFYANAGTGTFEKGPDV